MTFMCSGTQNEVKNALLSFWFYSHSPEHYYSKVTFVPEDDTGNAPS